MPDYYPINEFGPAMPGAMIGGLAIVHVFLAQFAVGGGMLMCYFQWLAMAGQNPHARQFVDGYFKALVLLSFVVGALTGVGIWFAAIQVSPATIGAMVDSFHWLWAAEWMFFCLEIVSGYCFYRYHRRLSDKASLTLLGLYSLAAWMSLFLINGILSWQLTPGSWVDTQSVAGGFFNPSFWPSLLYRSVVSLLEAALVACVVINLMSGVDRDARRQLINRAARLMLPLVAMPLLGIWYLAAMPADSRQWVLGGSPAMNLFLMISIAASLAVGAYALIGLVVRKLYINAATATLLVLLAFGATAGGEFVREGSRKPYSVRYVMFSNSIRPDQVARLRSEGCVTHDPYPLRGGPFPGKQVKLGAKTYRFQCSICHTLDGMNGLSHLTENWDADQMRMNIAKLQQTKPFMPPFSGSPDELEALVQFLRWSHAKRPPTWPESRNRETAANIRRWLHEAGTAPASRRPRS
jgi:cytochrome bd ubiquinol oxidase subunit I